MSHAETVRRGAEQVSTGLHHAAAATTQVTEAAGHLAQAAQPLAQHAKSAYKLAMTRLQAQAGATTGGGSGDDSGYFGGNDAEDPMRDIKAYRLSLASKTKEDTIRGLARALKRAGVEVDPDGSLDEIVAQLKDKIPDPRKGKTFAQDAERQEKICRTVARVLNDEFNRTGDARDNLIDMGGSPKDICWQVAEYVHSFATGLHTEFLEVHASVRRVLRNLKVLGEVMRRTYNGITAKISEQGSSELKRDTEGLDDIYRRARGALEEQKRVLENFLHVTLAPAEKELEIALRDQSEAHQLIRKWIVSAPGSTELSDSIALTTAGLVSVAAIASRVEKALKEIGLGVEQYLDSADMQELQRLLDEKMATVDPEKMGEFLEAVNTLRENFHRRDEVAGSLREQRRVGMATTVSDEPFEEEFEFGGDERKYGGLFDDNDDDDDGGGNHILGGDGQTNETALDRRVKKRKAERKLILKEFVDRSTKAFDQLLSAVKEMGPHLGKKIPLSDKLEDLRNNLARLRDLKVARIEFALLGFWAEAQAREKRDQFINSLRAVVNDLDDLMALEMYSGASHYFARMREAMASLERIIEQFAEVVRKKWGGQEEENDEAHDEAKEEPTTRGGQDEEDIMPDIARSQWDLTSSINSFLYFYYIAKIRANLAQTGKELKFYGEKYGNVLGDAIAGRLQVLQSERDANRTKVTTGGVAGQTQEAFAAALGGMAAFASAEAATKAIKVAKGFVDAQYSCKVKFYRALEALDLYMKAFTDGIVNNPDDVKDIKRMLDGTQVIARWFTEETGNALAQAFELMPSWEGQNDPTAVGPPSGLDPLAHNNHYYTLINEGGRAGTPVGVPVFGLSPGATVGDNGPNRVDAVKQAVHQVTDNFQALKNLMNAFARIGDKFGGTELRRKIHMSPTQIYKALLEYVRCSALSIGIGQSTGVPPNTEPSILLQRAVRVAPVVAAVGRAAAAEVPAGRLRVVNAAWADVPGARELLVHFGSVRTDPNGNSLQGDFTREDRFFTFMIKAVAAKIMTVVGVFDLFNRPSPVYDLTPTRMVIGGAEYDALPEIISEAMELYFRLPRLAEFYRQVLNFDTTGTDMQIALLPDIEGVFSGLIRQVFIRADVALQGDYSDSEVRDLVRECNAIYGHFREKHGPEKAVQSSIMGFVDEINRRFGTVKKDQWEKYMKLMQEARRAGEFGVVNKTDYAILPGEDEWEPERSGPSEAFLGPGAVGEVKLRGGKYKLDPQEGTWMYWDLLRNFRQKMDGLFASDVVKQQFTTVSYGTLIRQAQLEAKRATTDEGKFAIVTRLIQGSRSLASTDVNKAFMFHETVVLGLNTLTAIYRILKVFQDRLTALDVGAIEEVILETVRSRADAGANFSQANIVFRLGQKDMEDSEAYILAGASDAGADNGGALNGRGGAPANLTAVSAYSVARANAQAPGETAPNNAEKTGQRFIVNRQLVMLDLLSNLFELTGSLQGLVSLRFPSTQAAQISIDFSKLRSLVESLMGDVRHFMDIFRPHMDRAVIEKYENAKLDNGDENPGSLYWLEEKLLDGMVRGLTDVGGRVLAGQTTLEQLSRKANSIFINLTKREDVVGTGLARMDAGGPGVATAAPVDDNVNAFEQYGGVFAQLVFYDSSRTITGGIAVATAGGAVNDFDFAPLGGLTRIARPTRDVPALPQAGGANARRHQSLYGSTSFQATLANGVIPERSLMFFFNQCIAQYLRQFYDSSSGKIYQQLFSAFANGAFSQQVMLAQRGYSAPDLTANNGNFLRRGDPKPGGVLLQSLGLIMQRLMRDTNPNTQVSDHLTSTLSEVPLYMKEAYRAHLPVFSKLFDLVNAKGEMLKLVLQRTQIKVGRPEMDLLVTAVTANDAEPVAEAADPAAFTVAADENLGARVPANANVFVAPPTQAIYDLKVDYDDDNVKQRTIGLIDSIVMGAYSMSSAIGEVMRELADSPVYFQTQENSIDMYRSRYDRLPLMPLSLAAVTLRDNTLAAGVMNDQTFFPIHGVGSPQFKMLYGTRQLLGQPKSRIEWEQVPGVRSNLEAYNGLVTKREALSEEKYKNFVGREIAALRFLLDTRTYRGIMAITVRTLAPTQFTEDGIDDQPGNAGNSIYSLRGGARLEAALDVVETSDQTGKISDISDLVGGAVAGTRLGRNREHERIFNIIDMNIIPLNIHALMRDVPLTNTYNYAYTFEQMACLMYGMTMEHVSNAALHGAAVPPDKHRPQTTREVFLKLLLEPYENTSEKVYGNDALRLGQAGYVHRIFRGDNNLGMGRPKFLSDQLFNKALFGSLFPAPYDYDEAGPPAGAAVQRGRAGVGRLGRMADLRARGVDENNPGASMPFGPAAAAAGRMVWPPSEQKWQPQADITAIANTLTFVKRDRNGPEDPSLVRVVDVGDPVHKRRLMEVGKERWDTRFVRKLFFITNVLRLMRLKLNRDLTQVRTVLASSHRAVAPSVTEYGNTAFGPNEEYSDTGSGFYLADRDDIART